MRGYSAESLKKMRQFYEEWQIFDTYAGSKEEIELTSDNSVIAITELQSADYIFQVILNMCVMRKQALTDRIDFGIFKGCYLFLVGFIFGEILGFLRLVHLLIQKIFLTLQSADRT